MTANPASARSFAFDGKRIISRPQFVGEVQWVAQQLRQLESAGRIVNLCADRYAFLVTLNAAYQADLPVILPQNTAKQAMQQLLHADDVLVYDSGSEAVIDGLEAYQCQRMDNWLIDARDHLAGVVARSESTELPINIEDTAATVFTSGSEGRPKPLAKTWHQLKQIGELESDWLLQIVQQAENHQIDVVQLVATVPPQHMYGLETSVMTAQFGAVCMHTARPFFPADVVATLQQMPAPRVLVTTPVHLKVLLKSSLEIPSLAACVCATAALDPELADEVERSWQTEVHEIFGFSEAGAIAHRQPTQQDYWTLFAGITLQQNDDHIAIDAAHLTQPTIVSDAVEVLDEQRFVWLGRAGDMLNFAGKRASLAHLNQILLGISGVEDGVLFQPQEMRPETSPEMPPETASERSRPSTGGSLRDARLVALVVSQQLSAEEVSHSLRQHLDPVYWPKPVLVVPKLPRNAVGKLSQQQLQAYWQQLTASN